MTKKGHSAFKKDDFFKLVNNVKNSDQCLHLKAIFIFRNTKNK